MQSNRNFQTIVFTLLVFAAGLYSADLIKGLLPQAQPPAAEIREPVASEPANPVFFDYELPQALKLCGETMPLHDRHVWEMLDREFNITVWDHAQMFMYLKRAGRYFPYIEGKLAEAGIPDDLKYLAVAESALITHSLSQKGARGPWQFMTVAARANGLRRDGVIDERLSFERSTEAALGNLKRLYDKFGSWTLAMAAYNGGETRLKRAIRDQQTRDYYRLNLPLETERYVFRIAAIKIAMEDPERFGYNLSPRGGYRPQREDVAVIKTNHAVLLVDLAAAIGTDFKELKERNPRFLGDHIPPGTHTLRLPPTYGIRLINHLATQTSHNPTAVLIVSDREENRRH